MRHISISGLFDLICWKAGHVLPWWIGYIPPNLKLIRPSIIEIWHLYLQYVTLHCDLDDWLFDLERLSKFFVTRSNSSPTSSILQPSDLELWCSHSDCYNGITNSLSQRNITWRICKGLTLLSTFSKSVTPICLFTLQLLWRYDAD